MTAPIYEEFNFFRLSTFCLKFDPRCINQRRRNMLQGTSLDEGTTKVGYPAEARYAHEHEAYSMFKDGIGYLSLSLSLK